MQVDEPFTVQFVHDQHFRHNLFTRLFGDFQELGSVFYPGAFLFNLLDNAEFTPEVEKRKPKRLTKPYSQMTPLQLFV